MKLSRFGKKFSGKAGITRLMDDLGNALADGKDMIMMGGGNPAHIPEVQAAFRSRMRKILGEQENVKKMIGIYDPPQGDKAFISALASLLQREFGWNISEKNIALSNGSQSAFFMLFNMFAGDYEDGVNRKIHFPLSPEYIGYTDLGLTPDFFITTRPKIEELENNQFKYRVDFQNLKITEETGALCVSRPSNPTGNVLTDDEVEQLAGIAEENKVPLILDCAYGTPFPNLIFNDCTPFWNDNTIVSMSLSKFGLPSVRTGIMIANEEIINAFSKINAVINLATGSFGSMLAIDLVKSGEIIQLSNNVIRPFYQRKAEQAVQWFQEAMSDCPWRIHKPEGAMFLWLWLKDLPISNMELYERLKERGVLIVSGHYFFPGIDQDWRHQYECIRVTYSQEDEQVKAGIGIIAEEVKKAYDGL